MADTVEGGGSWHRMHLGHRELLVQLDIGAGEGRGAGDLAINGLHHPYAGHPFPPGVPEVLLEDVAPELEDHGVLQNGQGLAQWLDNVQHHEAAGGLPEKVEPDQLQGQHANQFEALDLRIQSSGQETGHIPILREVVAAEEQSIAGEAYLVLA